MNAVPDNGLIKQHKGHIVKLKKMLNALDPRSDDFVHLLGMQRYIFSLIVHSEEKVQASRSNWQRLKGEIKSGSTKEKSRIQKAELKDIESVISAYKYLMYIWRCFGDGIAFKFISKWNLKRLFFEADSYRVKQGPGNIGGKDGMQGEWELLEHALDHKVPALLCDITNSIRHGDVCLLGARDPYVFEVKSSKNLSLRAKRQKRNIDIIHDYLKKDEGEVGGYDDLRRIEVEIDGIENINSINEVVSSVAKGVNIKVSPEEGLYYIGVVDGKDIQGLFDAVPDSVMFDVNAEKTNMTWGNWYPFVLSIKDPDSLFDFIVGKWCLFVVIDKECLLSLAREEGFEVLDFFSNESTLVLQDIRDSSKRPIVVDGHFIGRLGQEFMSLKSFFKCVRLMSDDIGTSEDGAVGYFN